MCQLCQPLDLGLSSHPGITSRKLEKLSNANRGLELMIDEKRKEDIASSESSLKLRENL